MPTILIGCGENDGAGNTPRAPAKAEATAPTAPRKPEYPPDPIVPGSAEAAARLPPPPADLESGIPRTYPDGAWSVSGIRQDIASHEDDGASGKRVALRAHVVEVYAPDCPPGEICASAPAHVWVADRPTESNPHRRMLVVGYGDSEPPLTLKKGEQYTFKGFLARASNDGEFVDLLGLFQSDALRDTSK